MVSNKLEDTGERMIPEFHKGRDMYGAHVGRYEAGILATKDKVVLDIACGTGYGTKMIASKAKKVYGVDIDEATIDYAKKNYSAKNISYLVGSATAIPLEDKSVDAVVSYETIEHIEDYELFMKEVKRVLRPDGLFILSTPNDAEYMEGNHFHIHEFKYRELKALVEKYFKHHEDYFQTLWLYSSIFSKKLLSSEWRSSIDTISTISLKPDQCIYFYLLCSDRPIDKKVSPIGVISEHYRHKKLEEENKKRQLVIQGFKNREKNLKQENTQLAKSQKKYQEQINEIVGSKSYKLGNYVASPFRFVVRTYKNIKNQLNL